ncbi:unnamed protein product [Meganyctiphanes norvegica]|uniref:Cytochrome c biogenesis B n=1 Tax=Meganyctiphanes norvegica TaxID=48144 RepID=A0AAV2SEF0_MEGNR
MSIIRITFLIKLYVSDQFSSIVSQLVPFCTLCLPFFSSCLTSSLMQSSSNMDSCQKLKSGKQTFTSCLHTVGIILLPSKVLPPSLVWGFGLMHRIRNNSLKKIRDIPSFLPHNFHSLSLESRMK